MLLPAQLDGERLGVEARAAAALARDAHVGQEAHLDLLHALALAAFAAPARRVEREAARVVAAHARLGRVGEQPADRRPRSRRRSRGTSAASCRSASGRPRARGRSPSQPSKLVAARELRRLAAARAADERAQVVVQHVADSVLLPLPRHAGHHDEPPSGTRDVELAQVVRVAPSSSSHAGGVARSTRVRARVCSGCCGGARASGP